MTELGVAIWKAINEYVSACGGDPGAFIYGNTRRQAAVVKLEGLLELARAEDVSAEPEQRRL